MNKSGPETRPESDDPWVTRVLLHKSADRTVNNARPTEQAIFDPSINQAHEVFTDSNNLGLKWYLEALLLTEEPFDNVAERCGLTATNVETYEAVFFDVRCCRQATDWLVMNAVGSSAFNHFAGLDDGSRWKHYAIFGGIHALDMIRAVTGVAPWPDWLSRAARSNDPGEIERFKQKVRLTCRLQFATNDEEIKTIIEMMERLRALGNPSEVSEGIRSIRKSEHFLKAVPEFKRKYSQKPTSKKLSKRPAEKCLQPPRSSDILAEIIRSRKYFNSCPSNQMGKMVRKRPLKNRRARFPIHKHQG